MNILVTNDDGINALGIKSLVEALHNVGNVYVVAPDSQKSACGHGITIHVPVLVHEVEFEGAEKAWSVSGTPADCVKLGISELVDGDIDMVFSGINQGGNLGTDVLYSGTVSGAVEGILLGIPSVAVSVDNHTAMNFNPAKKIARNICQHMAENQLEPETLLNVNVPYIPEEEIKGVEITPLGIREYTENFTSRKDPRGRAYYWYSGIPKKNDMGDEDTDVMAIEKGYISVTPIHFDLTNYRIINNVKKWGISYK
ncbi:MAG: 5'/3'-nucleotidase SurE [Clostridia bacterium]|nr:5'/3'-nucleotidase SurE [Clostridia bacterium]